MRLVVTTPPPTDVVARLVDDAVASRLTGGTGGIDTIRAARPLAGEVEALREKLRVAGMVRVVLATSDGVGIAAEALAPDEPRLIVLDTPDPAQVTDALAGDLDATVLVVAAPPGADRVGADLVVSAVHDAFRAEGLDPGAHTVHVLPPGADAPAESLAVHPPGDVRFGYALVAAGLAGADIRALLAEALDGDDLCADSPDNPALLLGALLAEAPLVALAGPGPTTWIAQLLAARTLAVVVESDTAPGWDAPLAVGVDTQLPGAQVTTSGGPVTQMLLWRRAVDVATHLREAPERPTGSAPGPRRSVVDGDVEIHAGPWLPGDVTTVTDALQALAATGEHMALHAYLDREGEASAAVLRAEAARRTGRTVTFDWSPRGPRAVTDRTVICQLTGDDPGPFEDLAALQLRQADDDATAAGRPVLRLHLRERLAGLVTVARAVQHLTEPINDWETR